VGRRERFLAYSAPKLEIEPAWTAIGAAANHSATLSPAAKQFRQPLPAAWHPREIRDISGLKAVRANTNVSQFTTT
jgi:hypothetical protein